MRHLLWAVLLSVCAQNAGAAGFIIENDVAVTTPDREVVCALVVRPLSPARVPAILTFTIYNDPARLLADAERSAAHGYAGVIGLTRGKGCSSGAIVPYLHDGADADALIAWIAAQSWSDGQVGMYGGSYDGFAAWAATKHIPKALKAIMVGAPLAPGIDIPMDGNVFWNFIYPWPFYTTNNSTLDDATYNDSTRWQKLNHAYYALGRAYRDLDKIDARPNPIFNTWLAHPQYDAYWQSLIPYRDDFAHIGIPVLQTAGYYFGGPGSATYYFEQYQQHDPKAENYLVIGPYDHLKAQHGPGADAMLSGYTLDPAAHVDLIELRYRWFDYVLRHGPKPDILADRVNYEVTGANVWKHAPSLDGMARGNLKFYLSGEPSGERRTLSPHPSSRSATQLVDFADRRDVDQTVPGGNILDKDLDSSNGIAFVSAPFARPKEFSGLFSGRLDFVTNKMDFDFQISLYALLPDGNYLQLAPYWARASAVADISARHLLVPGVRQTLAFRANRLMSSLLPKGSRLVAVLGIIKNPGQEINYGTGGTVADESMADAKVPLKIDWLGSSTISVPLGR